MLKTKYKILRLSAAGVAMVLVSAMMLAFLPKAFATQDYFAAVGSSIKEGTPELDRFVTVQIKALKDATIYDIEGNFTPTEESDEDLHLTMLNPSEKFVDSIQEGSQEDLDVSDGKFFWKNVTNGVEFAANEVIWTAIYVVGEDVSEMSRSVPVSLEAVSFGSADDPIENETLAATVSVTPLPSQDISYETATETKNYGDAAFTKTLSGTPAGTVTYVSSDDSVATVDENTGEVTIVGVGGPVRITATAAATSEYRETSAYYDLTVNKKSISISEVTVSDKTYDGTTAASVSTAVLSDSSLKLQDGDFTVEANFADANAGTDKTATAVVTLASENADLYELSDDTYEVTGLTISPFSISAANVILEPESFVFSCVANEPAVTVKAKLDGQNDTILTENTDYTVSYEDNTTSAGTKTVTIDAIGNFTDGSDIEVDYEVEQYQIVSSDITLEYDTVRYDGTAKEPGVTVKIGSCTVENEYTVSYSENTGLGDATVTVTAKENQNIKGEASTTFQIIDKDVLTISGIESGQEITYTGNPVILVGNLVVGENDDNITVGDLTTTWYASDGATVIDQPTDAGSYVVKYTYSGTNYEGALAVSFDIKQATSPEPAEMTAEFRVEAGKTLAEIGGTRTTGFAWVDSAAVVSAGAHTYAATYAFNNDSTNYTTLNLNVPVYGYSVVNINTTVEGDGGIIVAPATATEDVAVDIEFVPDDGYELESVTLNNIDVIDAIEDGVLTVTPGTIDINIVANFRRVYTVVEGDGGSYVAGGTTGITFKINADFSLFENGGELYIDGALVNSKYYTVSAGSTVITLSADYLNILSAGDHTLAVVFGDGSVARASFTTVVNENENPAAPDTGFFTGVNGGARVAGAVAIVVALAGVAIFAKKKFAKSKVDFDKK